MPNLNLNTTGSVNLQPLFTPVLNRYVLEVAKPYLAFSQCGQKVKLQKGQGSKIIAFDKYVPLPLAKTPLTEGVTPDGKPLTVTRVTGEATQHGAYVATSDEFDFYAHDPSPKVLKITELLGQNAAETFESLTCDIVAAGTNVQYAGGRASRAAITASDKLTYQEVKKAVRTLKNNKARRDKGNFICILDPDTAHDFTNSEEWKNVKYNDPKDMYAGEIGVLGGVRFIETTETESELLAAYNQDAEVKIHFAYVFGADAYGTLDTKENVEIITHDKQSIGGPLNQYSTMGWVGHHFAKILVPEWFIRIECAVSE